MRKISLNRMQQAWLAGCASAMVASQDKQVQQSARIGLIAGAVLGVSGASAQGFIQGMQNMNTLMQGAVAVLITIGLVGGLGAILGGLWSAYKKHDRGNDDVSWAKIGMQIGAGGMMMALGWVGVNVVSTLGGSSSDIGKSITH
jgi:hypothetical protein